jgi:hypothetical protein
MSGVEPDWAMNSRVAIAADLLRPECQNSGLDVRRAVLHLRRNTATDWRELGADYAREQCS